MSDPDRQHLLAGDSDAGSPPAPSPGSRSPRRSPPSPSPAPTPAAAATTNANATAPQASTTPPNAATTGSPPPAPLDLPPVFIDRVPQQRSSLSSMIMLTLLYVFMSSGNSPHHIEIGDDGEIKPRVTELDRLRTVVGEYRGYLNGTGNWTEPAPPELYPTTLVPARYDHSSSPGPFFQNITGWYRRAKVTPVNLLTEVETPPFFAGVHLPNLNTSAWNETRAAELRGEFDWAHVVTWDMNVRERWIAASWFKEPEGKSGSSKVEGGLESMLEAEYRGSEYSHGQGSDARAESETVSESESAPIHERATVEEHSLPVPLADPPLSPTAWAWVKGSATLTSRPPPPAGEVEVVEQTINYDFFGLHFLANGTYELYSLPEGVHLDIRNIPRLFPHHHNITAQIVLHELEKELAIQEASLLLTDVKPDEQRASTCPLLIHLALPPLPPGVKLSEIQAYDAELANPTGILTSLTRPPHYWMVREGLGGVIVADQCGFAFGFEQGKGVGLDDFWRKSVNYAAYATVSQFIVLILLVRQMEATRTPSTLAKVSLWTIVLIGVSDAWIFSGHLALGVMSNNKTSLPMIVPGFCALCTAIVFAPRYAVLLHRIQAPERTVVPRPSPPTANTAGTGSGTATPSGTATGPGANAEESISFWEHVSNTLAANPILKWVGCAFLLLIVFNLLLTPQIYPFIFFAMHSVWIPQIWRNARRGSTRGLHPSFVLGLSVARLALPLYGLACPDNVFFVERADWVWLLVAWVAVQVVILFAQDRFGPAFFLPKRFAPQEGYDYHPVLPNPSDPESSIGFEGGSTCSICMEEVDVRGGATAAEEGSSAGALLAMNARRSYAVAPCHHLFHTKCLQQWMAIKTICPLCKRPLPPL